MEETHAHRKREKYKNRTQHSAPDQLTSNSRDIEQDRLISSKSSRVKDKLKGTKSVPNKDSSGHYGKKKVQRTRTISSSEESSTSILGKIFEEKI